MITPADKYHSLFLYCVPILNPSIPHIIPAIVSMTEISTNAADTFIHSESKKINISIADTKINKHVYFDRYNLQPYCNL